MYHFRFLVMLQLPSTANGIRKVVSSHEEQADPVYSDMVGDVESACPKPRRILHELHVSARRVEPDEKRDRADEAGKGHDECGQATRSLTLSREQNANRPAPRVGMQKKDSEQMFSSA